jgi:ketol-acid reductoisomerase
MSLQILKEPEVRSDALLDKTAAVLGFGAQGQAHALNLRDSGLRVVVAQRPGGPRHRAASEAGFEPVDIPSAVRTSDLLIMALPDDAAPDVYREEILPHLRAGQTLGFIHGFNIHYKLIEPPADVDVILVAPKAQGRGVRREYEAGRGVFAFIAIAQDATGRARETALAWAAGLGCGRTGVAETTFAIETETDLFGEQAVLCGGLTALIKAGFETLVEAGYPAEAAYFECCHEVKLITDLLYDGGIAFMRERISSTARFGDVTRGPRVVGDASREAMRKILAEIRSGQFTREFLADRAAGAERISALTDADCTHPVEMVGKALREAMWGQGNR